MFLLAPQRTVRNVPLATGLCHHRSLKQKSFSGGCSNAKGRSRKGDLNWPLEQVVFFVQGFYIVNGCFTSYEFSIIFWPKHSNWSLLFFQGGGFLTYILSSPLPGEMIQFHKYFSDGLKTPSNFVCSGVIKLPSLGESNNANLWYMRGIFPSTALFGLVI